MNIRKIAVFVEGQTEYIFVRDFLCTWYDYDANRLGLECYQFNGNQANDVPYPYGTRKSENFYLIYNVGNDQTVMSKMLKEAPRLLNNGYDLIVGLNDMYCDSYHTCVKNRQIDTKVNEKFKDKRKDIIHRQGFDKVMKSHFAIMEVEAWFLGMYDYLQRINSRLTPELIKAQLNTDITQDPEISVYHPAKLLNDIYQLEKMQYGKHASDAHAITSTLTKNDYLYLMRSGKCQSFKEFIKDIIY